MAAHPVTPHPHAKGLRQYVADVKSRLPYLPLIHITDAIAAGEITATGELQPRACRHFLDALGVGEQLVYLSYGRPSYRGRPTQQSNTNWGVKPVAFVFKPAAVKALVHRVLPFDSGGYFCDIFETWIDRNKHPIAEFQLDSDLASARRVVQKFFGSNQDYFKARINGDHSDADPANFSLRSYIDLIKFQGINAADDRRLAIEVQLDQPLAISVATLQAVIIPDEAMNSKRWKAWSKEVGLIPDYYLSEGSFGSPSEWDGILRNKTLEAVRGLQK